MKRKSNDWFPYDYQSRCQKFPSNKFLVIRKHQNSFLKVPAKVCRIILNNIITQLRVCEEKVQKRNFKILKQYSIANQIWTTQKVLRKIFLQESFGHFVPGLCCWHLLKYLKQEFYFLWICTPITQRTFFIKDFFDKCNQIHSFLCICSH